MIIIKIQGGLCNQLFQWAFGYSLSKKFGVKDYYDISFYTGGANRAGYTDVREFCLPDLLNIEIPILTQDIVDQFHAKVYRDGSQKFIQEPSNGSFMQIKYDKNFLNEMKKLAKDKKLSFERKENLQKTLNLSDNISTQEEELIKLLNDYA